MPANCPLSIYRQYIPRLSIRNIIIQHKTAEITLLFHEHVIRCLRLPKGWGNAGKQPERIHDIAAGELGRWLSIHGRRKSNDKSVF
jgi:hypothetical protein